MSRRQDIVELVEEHGFQSVNSLARKFGVDASTIRRDLERLADEKMIRRTHGGAAAVAPPSPGYLAADQQTREKQAIGAATADRILENQTVLLDSGTTCLEVAKHLNHSRLTVVTHDLLVGVEVSRKPRINLVFIGGELLPGSTSMWGPASLQQLENMRINVAVFGAGAVMDDGIYASSSYSIELKRKMRSVAAEAFFVADSTKFGREALFKVFGFEDFTAGITDDAIDPIRAARWPIPLIRASTAAELPVIDKEHLN
ncbi:DeoR/GlpR family DNA-binding transcription regulator [Arthrobacter sp. Soil762]|uniref:DeoR/GlpR family DNA-binding transcription regulator n=1 Tax=Arthrobacter sp. Soil762 TaxID=1736401 RepID=UPI0006FDC924|nr:DeoR/GlpR family DNA-binding transcription regulator [Arthrobacter sp. Soil762]KRE80936.1 DeoR family transcriptional regulator [Arthrobacter sp. Soil762]